METILKVLTKDLEWDIKEQCDRRYLSLVQQLNYLIEKKDQTLFYTFSKGWFSDKYKTLFSLNTFYHIVIGPLASSTRSISKLGIGSKIPIAYGKSIKFNTARNKVINEIYADFIDYVIGLGFQEWWLVQNQASDAIYQISKSLREHESE